MRLLFCVTILLGLVGQHMAQVPSLPEIQPDHAISVPGLSPHAQFGTSVDIDGNQMIVGAHNHTAYLFEKVGDTWTLTDSLHPADEDACAMLAENSLSCNASFFLKSVAIYGDYAVVGGGRLNRAFAPPAATIACEAPDIASDSLSRRTYSVLYKRTPQGWQMERFLDGDDVEMNNGVIASQGTIYYGYDNPTTLDCSRLNCYDDGFCGGYYTFLYRLTLGQWQEEYREYSSSNTWWYDYKLRMSLSQSGDELSMLEYEVDYAPTGIGVLIYRNGAWQRVPGTLYAVEGDEGVFEAPYELSYWEGLRLCSLDGAGFTSCQTLYDISHITYGNKRYQHIENALMGEYVLIGEPDWQQIKVVRREGDSVYYHRELVPPPNTTAAGFGSRIYHDGTQIAVPVLGSNVVYVYDAPLDCSLPPGFSQSLIGINQGEVCYNSRSITMTQGGTGFSLQGDEFQQVFTDLTGDAEMQIHVAEMPSNSGGTVGIRVYNGQEMFFIGQSTAPADVLSSRRYNSLGLSYCPRNFLQRASWYKVVREGSLLKGYRSADGQNWYLMGSRNFPRFVEGGSLYWAVAGMGDASGQTVRFVVDSLDFSRDRQDYKTQHMEESSFWEHLAVQLEADALLIQAVDAPATPVFLRLMSINGQLLTAEEWRPATIGLTEKRIPLEPLSSGVYVLQLTQEGQQTTYTFIR